VDYALVGRARHFHLGYPPLMKTLFANEGDELAAIFRQAQQAGATTSLDMSLPDPDSESGRAPWDRILRKTLPHVNIFLPSIEEAVFMTQPERLRQMKAEHGGGELIDYFDAADYSELSDRFLAYGSKVVALKSGHRGFYVRTGNATDLAGMGRARPGDMTNWADRELWCPAYHVDPIASATGSGDSSIAGFLAAFLRGETIERTLKYANTVGSLNLTELDALSGLKDWPETTRLMEDRSRPLNRFAMTAPGWRFDESLLMWVKR